MLKKRIIPVLLLKNGRMVKGVQFDNYRDTGDAVSASRIYNAQYADELMFIDIEASGAGRGALLHVIEEVSEECFMPLTVGGGVRSCDDIQQFLRAGADKVLITTAATESYEVIRQGAEMFGAQCIVAGVDIRTVDDQYRVFSHCGKTMTELELIAHIEALQDAGAGELLITSIDRDGGMEGYDLGLFKLIQSVSRVPVIVNGGAGHFMHLVDAIKAGAHAVACASVFHFGDNNPIRARSYLKNHAIAVKNVK